MSGYGRWSNSRKAAHEKYYVQNQASLQKKSLTRWERQKANMTAKEWDEHCRRHREAAARYRAQNRLILKIKAWEYRQTRKAARDREAAARKEAEMLAAMEAME
ncbi:hypothetical protein Hypma_006938 [Hypsizygus marmoreus]|uniref:Uncharacterized protein n=1 Tax=Hypsizygus marmoreus TaxID=39966 RepID=A0A369K5L1_HYPMA|nr:hypothetical protein Hypma_006938 [Hypsizygus marmoreus]